jgi:hypothetical protein
LIFNTSIIFKHLYKKILDAKKMLGNSQLLSMLKNFPKDDLSDKQVKKVNKYFNEDLTLEKMQQTSKAGFGLLTWVVAIVKVRVRGRVFRFKVKLGLGVCSAYYITVITA